MSPAEFLSRILDVLARAASARTPQESVEDAADAFRHLCRFDAAALLLPAREGVARRNYEPTFEVWRAGSTADPDQIRADAAVASAGERGRALVATAQGLSCEASRELMRAGGHVSVIALPLRVKDRPIGTLAFLSADPRAFAAVDLNVLLAGAAVVAVAIEHARDRAALGTKSRTPRVDLRPLADIERDAIARVLAHTGGRVSGSRGAAAILRMKPTTLASRMKKLGVRRKP
jgi:transcriptional regulator with GAF, ATPase, and Fis domain